MMNEELRVPLRRLESDSGASSSLCFPENDQANEMQMRSKTLAITSGLNIEARRKEERMESKLSPTPPPAAAQLQRKSD